MINFMVSLVGQIKHSFWVSLWWCFHVRLVSELVESVIRLSSPVLRQGKEEFTPFSLHELGDLILSPVLGLGWTLPPLLLRSLDSRLNYTTSYLGSLACRSWGFWASLILWAIPHNRSPFISNCSIPLENHNPYTLWPWAYHLVSLCLLSFLSCKMENLMVSKVPTTKATLWFYHPTEMRTSQITWAGTCKDRTSSVDST